MPVPKKLEHMEAEGWFKDLTIKHVEIKEGRVWVEEWDFIAESLPCKVREGGTGPPCGTEFVFLKCQGGKLMWTCWKHRTGMGSITFDVGAKAAEYIISATEAIKICSETGQEVPDALKAMAAAERLRTGRERRRPKHVVGEVEEKAKDKTK